MLNIKIYIYLFVLFQSTVAIAQTLEETKLEEEKKVKEFEEILSVQFSKVITGTSFSNFGNFAAVSTDEKSLSAAVNIIENNRSVFNAKISGGATDGITELFTKGDLNSNVGLDVSYHWIDPFSKIKVERDASIKSKLDADKQKILKKFFLDSIEALNFKELNFAELSLISSSKKIGTLKGSYNNLASDSLKQKHKRDSIFYEIKKAQFEFDELKKNVQILRNDKKFVVDDKIMTKTEKQTYLLLGATQSRDLALKEIDDKRRNTEVDVVKFSWFSLGYGVRNDSFKYFDSGLNLKKQVMDTSYTSHNLRFAYSQYNWAKYKEIDTYFSFGFNIMHTSDLTGLSKREIRDVQSVSSEPLRESVASQVVYEGVYKENVNQLALFVDYYLFYGFKRTVALHLNPKVVYTDGKKPASSLSFGFLVPFQKVDEQASVVNLEIFYQLNDVFNTLESKTSLLGRNAIGLKATFPITFL